MSIKKMSLLVSSGLVFFLVVSVIINTVSTYRKRAKEKIDFNINKKINLDNMVSSYNYITVEKEEEETKEETQDTSSSTNVSTEVVQEESSEKTVYVGKMTGYGADCNGCNGIGTLSCSTKEGEKFSLGIDGQNYTDSSYGSVRIVAADLSQFPCGTIVHIDHPNLGSFNAVVLDTGGSVQNAWNNGVVWMDLAFKTENDSGVYSSTSNNTTYTIERWGW